MRKVILLSITLAGITFTGCKKEYTCSCSYQTLSGPVTQITKIKETSKEAEKICESYETPVETTNWKCELLK